MTDEKIIYVDVDETIADLLTAWLNRYNQDYKDHLTPADIRTWGMDKIVKPECGMKIYDYIEDPSLYDWVLPIPGALEGVEALRQIGRVVFVTSSTNGAAGRKLRWLQDCGFLIPGKTMNISASPDYIEIADKGLLSGDILIDDGPHNITRFKGFTILFRAGHNWDFQWPVIAENWKQVLDKVQIAEMKQVVAGMGVDAPTTINEQGGRQSLLDYDFTLIDPLTLFHPANIVKVGAVKYGQWNWRRIGVKDNINHAVAHLFAFLADDPQDDHLGHAFCRIVFALSLHITPGESPRMLPDKTN